MESSSSAITSSSPLNQVAYIISVSNGRQRPNVNRPPFDDGLKKKRKEMKRNEKKKRKAQRPRQKKKPDDKYY